MSSGVIVVKNEFPKIAAHLLAASKIAPNDAAQVWAEAASSAAPVRTGTLAASGHANGNEVIFDAVNTSGQPYGVYVEYGTHDTPAQPFLRPTENVARERLEHDLSVPLEI